MNACHIGNIFSCCDNLDCLSSLIPFVFLPFCSLFILSVRLPEESMPGTGAQRSADEQLFAWNGIKTMYYLTQDTKQSSSQDFISSVGQVSASKGRRKCPFNILFRL